MNKKIEKYEILISISLIIIYILSNSYALNNYGITSYKTTIINFILTSLIIIFIIKNKLLDYYRLTSFPKPQKFLYFIPLILLVSINLFNGFNINNTTKEIIFYIISMLLVGFIEEIIFRGFLFKMLERDNIKTAIIITTLTFGIGHIINLLNGQALIPTLLQICYAISTGYLFAIIIIKSNSLWPCIITHSLVNALSIFNVEGIVSTYVSPILLTIIPIVYSRYLNKIIDFKK